MSELRVYADRSGLHEGSPWVLLDSVGKLQLEGHGIAGTPRADSIMIVVADECVSVFSLPLPNLPQKRLKQALPTIIEDYLLTTVDTTESILVEPPENGIGTLAAFSSDWMASMLLAPTVSRCPAVRVVVESWALPREESRISLYAGPQRVVLGLHNRMAVTEPTPAGTAKPEAIRFALRQAVRNNSRPLTGIACFLAPGHSGGVPSWLDEIGVPVAESGSFDWRTANFAHAPSLHTRQRIAFPIGAAKRAVRPAAILLTIFMAFELVATVVAYGRMAFENADLKAKQLTLFRVVMGADATLVDGERQLLQRLASQRVAAGQSEPSDLLVLLSRLAEKAGSMPALDELRFESGTLYLQFKTRNDQAAWFDLVKAADLTATAEVRDGKNLIRVRP